LFTEVRRFRRSGGRTSPPLLLHHDRPAALRDGRRPISGSVHRRTNPTRRDVFFPIPEAPPFWSRAPTPGGRRRPGPLKEACMSMETVQDVESMEGLRELLEREQLPPQVAQRRVLVVEDDPAQREFLVTLLA